MARYKVKAKRFGTRTGASGEIYHFNPEGSDERAVEPIVDGRDIPDLVRHGLIEDPGELGDPEADVRSGDAAAALHDPVAERAVAAIAPVEDELGRGASGLGHREATHYDPTQGVGADAGGIQAGDPDAPPSGGSKRGKKGSDASAAAAAGA